MSETLPVIVVACEAVTEPVPATYKSYVFSLAALTEVTGCCVGYVDRQRARWAEFTTCHVDCQERVQLTLGTSDLGRRRHVHGTQDLTRAQRVHSSQPRLAFRRRAASRRTQAFVTISRASLFVWKDL